jgi:putative peptidoglycan lipid II flippase
MLFQRGAFTVNSTELVSWALLWYTVGLLGHGVVEILSRAFYALHDTRTPVLVSVGAMSLNIVFSLIFSALFEQVGWLPFGGLALANSLATAIEMIALWRLMHRRLGGLEGRMIREGFLKSALATIIMGMTIWGWLNLTQGKPNWLVATGGVVLGGLVYVLVIVLLRTQETYAITQYVRRKIRRVS